MEPHWEAGTMRRRVMGGFTTGCKDDICKEMADFKRFRSPPYFSNVNIFYLFPIWYFYLDNMHES